MIKINIETLKPLIAKSPELLKKFAKLIDKKYGNGDSILNKDDLFERIKTISEEEILNIVKLDDDLLYQLQDNGCIIPSIDIDIDNIPTIDIKSTIFLPGDDVIDDILDDDLN